MPETLEKIWDAVSELFSVIWEIFYEFLVLLVTDFKFVLICIVAVIALWFFGGGYDRAEREYLAEKAAHNASGPVAPVGTTTNLGNGVYIIH